MKETIRIHRRLKVDKLFNIKINMQKQIQKFTIIKMCSFLNKNTRRAVNYNYTPSNRTQNFVINAINICAAALGIHDRNAIKPKNINLHNLATTNHKIKPTLTRERALELCSRESSHQRALSLDEPRGCHPSDVSDWL